MSNTPEDQQLIQLFLSTRDPTHREKIILRYIPLVHYVLGRLGMSVSMGSDYEDAASQGLIGLIEAVDRFDPAYGTQFSTYATLRIRGRVLDYLNSLNWLSRTTQRRARQVQEAATVLWSRLERAPTEEELAAYLQMDLPTLQQALVDSSRVIVSLDNLGDSGGEDGVSLYDTLRDEKQLDPGDFFDQEETKTSLVSALKSLSEREQYVLSLYYYNGLTFKEIGEVLKVSESRVCQLHARAITTLRAVLSQHVQESGGKIAIPHPAMRAGYDRLAAHPARR
jgi:RNA polymerase sigma factor for flagellar operon FliA